MNNYVLLSPERMKKNLSEVMEIFQHDFYEILFINHALGEKGAHQAIVTMFYKFSNVAETDLKCEIHLYCLPNNLGKIRNPRYSDKDKLLFIKEVAHCTRDYYIWDGNIEKWFVQFIDILVIRMQEHITQRELSGYYIDE